MEQPGLITCKCAVVGESDAGKTSLAVVHVRGLSAFGSNTEPTIGASFLTHSHTLPSGTVVKLHIWDTAGQERYRSLTPMYYRNASACLVVFSLAERSSFQRASHWLREIEQEPTPKVLVLVGNKADLRQQREVPAEEARRLAREHNVPYFETSAKTGAGVAELFEHVVAALPGVWVDRESSSIEPSEDHALDDDEQPAQRSCCSSN